MQRSLTGTVGLEYRPLNRAFKEIRCLILDEEHVNNFPSVQDALRFTITTVRLSGNYNETPAYYAISYAWGDDPGEARISVDGVRVAVPGSAEEALRGTLQTLPRAGLVRNTPIWIDAICLNQFDVEEKSWQVAMMGRVFSRACAVLVWLGQFDTKTARAAKRSVEALARDALRWTSGKDEIQRHMQLTEHEQDELPYKDKSFPGTCDMKAFLSLLKARWFTRLWVLQEEALAQEAVMFWSDEYIASEKLQLATHWTVNRLDALLQTEVCEAEGSTSDVLDVVGRAYAILKVGPRRRSGKFPGSQLVSNMIQLQVTNPHDKIYAILGLWKPKRGTIAMEPDYHRPLQELYTEATRAILAELGWKDTSLFLQYYPPHSCGLQDWPSWVIPFHVADGREANTVKSSYYPGVLYSQNIDGAGFGARASWSIPTERPATLQAQGVLLGRIQVVHKSLTSFYDMMAVMDDDDDDLTNRKLFRHFKYLWEPEFLTALGHATWTPHLFTLTASALFGGEKHRDLQLPQDTRNIIHPGDSKGEVNMFSNFMRRVQRSNKPFRINAPLEELICQYEMAGDRRKVEYWKLMRDAALTNPLVVIRGARGAWIGYGGMKIDEGDDVCIPFETCMPFVMRRGDDGWRIRGGCWVGGVMNGQYIGYLKREGWFEEETITFDIV